jgi:hypothetical protein
MALARITGPMLQANLERQGTNISIDAAAYFDVQNYRLGVNTPVPNYTLDITGNAHLGNVYVLANTITVDNGYKLNLGALNNLTLTGGSANNVVITDGAGSVNFVDLFTLPDIVEINSNIAGANASIITANNAVVSYVNTLNSEMVGNLANLHNFPQGITVSNITVSSYANIGGSLIVANGAALTGNTTVTGNLFVTGNLNLSSGNVNLISSNSAQFFGNAAGFGALYTGISSGYVVQPQTIIQSSANFNGYAQINAQNINNGASASTDFVATADNGSSSAGYIDMGINSSGFVGGPGNELNYPNDGYVYVTGTTSTNGNLLLGTADQADVVISTNGFGLVNQQARFKNNVGLILYPNTVSSSTSTGALVVGGGVGLGGNLNVGGNTSIAGNLISNSLTGNIIADTITPYKTSVTIFNSTTALGIPVGNIAQRPSNPVNGYVRYNTDYASMEVYSNGGWLTLGNEITSSNIQGDGSTATFTLTQVGQTDGMLVSINGVVQQPYIAYNVSGSSITFSQPPASTDYVDVRYLSTVIQFGSEVEGNLSVTGNLTIGGLLSAPQTTKLDNSPGTPGQIAWDASYIYVCTSTNTWKRVSLASF